LPTARTSTSLMALHCVAFPIRERSSGLDVGPTVKQVGLGLLHDDGLGDKQWDACSNMAALLNGEGLVIK